jgi:hypothetical protein
VSKQKRKQLKKLKYLQPKNHDYIFLVAICNILADKKTHTKLKLTKLKLSSYYREDKTPVLHKGWVF